MPLVQFGINYSLIGPQDQGLVLPDSVINRTLNSFNNLQLSERNVSDLINTSAKKKKKSNAHLSDLWLSWCVVAGNN